VLSACLESEVLVHFHQDRPSHLGLILQYRQLAPLLRLIETKENRTDPLAFIHLFGTPTAIWSRMAWLSC